MKRIFQFNIPIVLLLFFSAIVLALCIKGLAGNPTGKELNTRSWRDDGVFELSPERGRFALLYSIVEDKSLFFSDSIAQFSVPDVGFSHDHYVSLFAPAVSYIVIPGYIIGRYLGISQVGTFAIISLFALCNFVLIYLIARKLGADTIAAVLGALTFLFATPAFVYAINLYQHHISTFLILLSLYLLIKSKKIWVTTIVFFLCGLSISIDYPNTIFMFPIGLYALGRLINVENKVKTLRVKINPLKLLTTIAVVIPLLFLLWFQYKSYGNPFTLSGSVANAEFNTKTTGLVISKQDKLQNKKTNTTKTVGGFFKTRGFLNGFYLHFLSPDRGMITFTPVILLGFIGLIVAYRKKNPYGPLLISIILSVIVLYELWVDPWGGWAFGSRYLIPAYSMLSLFIAILLTEWRRKIIFIIIFTALFYYSVGVNTIGALATIANPPQVEVLALEKISGKVQRYSYDRGMVDYLQKNTSKSFVFNEFVKTRGITALQYYYAIVFSILLVGTILIFIYYITSRRYENKK